VKVTRYEKQLLRLLSRGTLMTPAQMIDLAPITLGNRTVQGVHQTAASLCRKGLARRHPGTPVAYSITSDGRQAIA
jgi:hypothetical protein